MVYEKERTWTKIMMLSLVEGPRAPECIAGGGCQSQVIEAREEQQLAQGHTARGWGQSLAGMPAFLSPQFFALLSHLQTIRLLGLVSVLSLEMGQRSQKPGQEVVRAGPKPQEAGNPRSTPM